MWKGKPYDQLLKPGDTQRFHFTEDDPPPFYDLEAPKFDTPTGKTNRKGACTLSQPPPIALALEHVLSHSTGCLPCDGHEPAHMWLLAVNHGATQSCDPPIAWPHPCLPLVCKVSL
jgi:hypothetical protein|eukprot:2512616-Prymnesium_polylepis.1